MTERKPRSKGRHGDGSIYWEESRQSYAASISLGYKPDGSRDRPTVRAKTIKEVKAKLKELKEDYDNGIELGDSYTVAQACHDFLKRACRRRARRPSTASRRTSKTTSSRAWVGRR